jgi:hypothetical protein
MFRRVELDPALVSNAYPDLLRRAQSTCDYEFATGTADANYVEFCPNAGRIRARPATCRKAGTGELRCLYSGESGSET